MTGIIDFYEEFSLNRNASTADIRTRLGQAKLAYAAKAARGGSMRSHNELKLELLSQAEKIFADEDSRDRYDVQLRRTDPPEEASINWVERASDYIAMGDIGAALIAARKAKEQAPENPMAYVVSAEVWLREGERKQAKRDVDEAFVLSGEQGADQADVLRVRAAVFVALNDHERAIASLASAIRQANEGAKPELYMRKAEAHTAIRQYASAYEAARDGLSRRVEIPETLRINLQDAALQGINQEIRAQPISEQLDRYSQYLTEIAFAPIDQDSKIRFIANVKESIDRCKRQIADSAERRQRRTELQEMCDRLSSVTAPVGPRPDVPWDFLKAAAVFVVIGIVLWQFSRGLGVVGFFAAAGCVVYFGVVRARRTEWTEVRAKYEAAQKALEDVGRELRSLERP